MGTSFPQPYGALTPYSSGSYYEMGGSFGSGGMSGMGGSFGSGGPQGWGAVTAGGPTAAAVAPALETVAHSKAA